jgi:aminomethyltransferase
VGKVTSGTYSPCLKYGVGMAYIDNKLAKIGNVCNVNVRGRDINIKITKMPFVEIKYFR